MNIEIREVKDEPFIKNGIKICAKQCNVFIDGKDKGIYGYPTSEEIDESIVKKKEIFFPECVVPELIISKEKLASNGEYIELEKMDFSFSFFLGHYQFKDLNIIGFIDFSNAQFIYSYCFFNNCIFEAIYKGNPKINFGNIECDHSHINFNVKVIDSNLIFDSSSIRESTIHFNNFIILKKSKTENNSQRYIRFYAVSLYYKSRIRFTTSCIESNLDLRFYEWIGDVSLTNVDIEKCQHIAFWTNSINGVFDAYGLSKQLVRCINNSIIDQNKVDASILLMLKKCYNKMGYFDDEDNLYVAYRRYQAIDKLEESKKKGLIKKNGGYLRYWVDRFLFDFVGGYGTKPKNVFRFMIIVVLGFTPLYAFIPNFLKWKEVTKHFCNIEFFNKLLIGLYHSMITFLTIGYGDIQPESVYGSLLSGFEGFLGLFLMAYFTIAFSRKVLR